jgi:rod shape determining protein RodA
MVGGRTLSRIDFRSLTVVFLLMCVSLIVISSYTAAEIGEVGDDGFFTPMVMSQIHRFALGWLVYFFCATIDYNKIREWTWFLYLIMIISLVGLFFTDSIQRVHRWYRIPFIGIAFQPSEYAKLVVVITLSWFLERMKGEAHRFATVISAGIIVGIPFLLILKQPDLGTSLVLFPTTLVMFYFGGVHPPTVKAMTALLIFAVCVILSIFLGMMDHEEIRPYATHFLKDYQYDRLDPNTHHQRMAQIAISIGGLAGAGWRNGDFTGGGWLPMPVTDSVFPAFAEEFGFIGLFLLMALFYALLYFGFQVSAVAKDHFGRLLAAGVTVYLAVHIIVNVGMMCGLLPITGVPLLLITYGGSSVFSTMAAIGILQSIYSRRFMF